MSVRRLMRRFARAESGIAALEFALVLPLMMVLYFGMTELTFAISTDRKVTLLSRALADLVGRTTSMTTAAMNDIFQASIAVMAPYDASNAKIVVTSIVVKATGPADGAGNPTLQGRVCWSEARGPGATKLAYNSIITIPDGFKTAGTSFIRADVELDYQPVFGDAVWKIVTPDRTGKITLNEKTPWPVRAAQQVVWPSNPLTPCPTT